MRIATLFVGIAVLMMAPVSEARRPSKTRVGLVTLSASGKGTTKVAVKTTLAVAKTMRRSRRISVVVFNPRRSAKLRQCMQVPDCVKAVGRKLNVQYLVSGQVLKLGGAYHVDMMVVARSTGGVISNGTYRVRNPWAAKTSGARLALNLVNKARQGIRVASAATTASDAEPASSNEPLFSRSEAESASVILEERDEENPLTRGAKASTRAASASAEGAGAAATAEAPASESASDAASAAPAELVVSKEPGLVSRLFSRRYTHAWSVAGAGVAALGAGVAFGVISSGANTAAREAQFQREAWLERDRARKNALTANILYGVGGAAVLTSVVLFYLEHRKETRELRNERDLSLQLQVAQQGGGVVVMGSF